MSKFDAAATAEGLISAYRDAKSASERNDVIGKQTKAYKPSQLRLLVSHLYEKDNVPVDHSDLTFLQLLLNYAIVLESGILDEKAREVAERRSKELIAKGPSLKPGEDNYQPVDEEEEDMDTQSEKTAKKAKAKVAAPKKEAAPKAKKQADWYDKDTKFIATPDKTDYSPNKTSRPAIVWGLLMKPITMGKLVEKFKTGMQESDLGKKVKNLDTLADRWVPGLVKYLLEEKKAVKVYKDGDPTEVAKPAAKKEKVKSKSKSAEA